MEDVSICIQKDSRLPPNPPPPRERHLSLGPAAFHLSRRDETRNQMVEREVRVCAASLLTR